MDTLQTGRVMATVCYN